MTVQCLDHIAKHNKLSTGVYVHVEHHIVLARVYAKGIAGSTIIFEPCS